MLIRLAVLASFVCAGDYCGAQSAAAMAAKRAAEQQFGVERPMGADRRERPRPEKWQASGRIHSMNARQINVITDAGEPWQVMLRENTAVKVAGEGGVELLKPRSAVRFEASVNARGVVEEPVTELTIFQPREGFQPMLEEVAEGEEGEGVEQEEAVEPERPVRRSTTRSATAAREAAQTRRVTVMGVLTSIRRGRFTVDAGEDGKVRGEIAEDATVKADFTTHAAARIGDTITIEGVTERAPNDRPPYMATAQKVEITLVPPAPVEDGGARRGGRTTERGDAAGDTARGNDREEPRRSGPAAD
ncbi:hypothetical protein Pla175_41280 [Pirellulimonas nuda]|uniref:Uncharacterized protein n=1 Tax=Pirellulimonas nuda TaxID=2528009 RepID=A0A518DGX5_9BACT|nr:hypothetical protein [Pirellulimonas nuda]QDU90717.1 hypothetical protein Pla175_41280 [Pirellulimonas nuda]